jgi:tetratricopeptide (TPR) repeat protein
MACCLRMDSKIPEAESLYRLTIQVRRELLRGSESATPDEIRIGDDSPDLLEDLLYLVSTTHLMANLLEAKGKTAEAEGLRRQLSDDVAAVAARLQGRQYQELRRICATRISAAQMPLFDSKNRRDLMSVQRLALLLDSEIPLALNNLADMLVSQPDEPWYNPAEGLRLAKKAVKIEPNEWSYLHTLGVAAFRAHDWDTAAKVLQQATTFTGSGSHVTFFLAMTYWNQGQQKEAQEMYNRAVAWMDQHKPNDPELRKFKNEAKSLLGTACPKPAKGTSTVATAAEKPLSDALLSVRH